MKTDQLIEHYFCSCGLSIKGPSFNARWNVQGASFVGCFLTHQLYWVGENIGKKKVHVKYSDLC